MKRSTIIEIISSLFILLFVYTALSKLYDPAKFKWSLSQSPILSNYNALIASALPAIELLAATLLFIPRTRKFGFIGSLALMLMFTGYIGYMIAFTPNLPCSCGGIIQQMSWKQHLIFNILMTGLAGFALLNLKSKSEPTSNFSKKMRFT